MRAEVRVVRPGLALLAILFMAIAPVMGAVNPVTDSEKVSGYLAEAKTQAIELQKDAEEMNSFVWTNNSWQTDAWKLNSIKDHVNALGALLTKMNDVKATASPWQQDAMDRVRPMLGELATNVDAQIQRLTKNEGRFRDPIYMDYAAANASTAQEMADMISDFVAYGNAKNKADNFERDLELPLS